MAKFPIPDPDEDAAISRAIAGDPDTWEMTDAAFDRNVRTEQLPRLRAFVERRRSVVAVDIDREVADRLRAQDGNWKRRANELLRKAVGLD